MTLAIHTELEIRLFIMLAFVECYMKNGWQLNAQERNLVNLVVF